MNLNYDEIVKTYFNQKNILVQHQINSYEEYIDKILPNIVSNYFPINIELNTDILETYQKSEVSEMKWFSLDECKQHIRDYNIEKIDMICKINSLLEKYKLIT